MGKYTREQYLAAAAQIIRERCPDEWHAQNDEINRLTEELSQTKKEVTDAEDRERALRHELADAQSYADLAASGGTVDAIEQSQHSEPGQGECGWSLDDEGYYQTDCGTEFVPPECMSLEELPTVKYCANCGRRIRDDSPSPDAEKNDGS